jgi:hypothetical protein
MAWEFRKKQRWRRVSILLLLTIIGTQYKPEDGIEPKETQKVPTDAADPSDVHIRGVDTPLKHQFEPKCEGKRQSD